MPASTIDEYLEGVPEDKRLALERLREQIRAAAPDAVEVISYGVPGFKLDGRYLVGFSAAKAFCSFYPGRAPILAHADELRGYRVLRGTISFQPDHPLPPDLVTRIIQVRIAEHRAG